VKHKALMLSAAVVLALSPHAGAQAGYAPPRTPDGEPDLQGTWTNSSITTLERGDPSLPLVLSPAQVRVMEEEQTRDARADAAPTDPTSGAPTDGAVIGYNAFWLDPGERIGVVRGQARSLPSGV